MVQIQSYLPANSTFPFHVKPWGRHLNVEPPLLRNCYIKYLNNEAGGFWNHTSLPHGRVQNLTGNATSHWVKHSAERIFSF